MCIRDRSRLDAIKPARLTGRINFENVSFDYTPGKPVLTDISFSARPGQVVGIFGMTGTGKSTLLGLIPRFYDPMAGTIRIDGIDVRDYRLKVLRDQIGYVLQETVLFRGTVRDNIAYGLSLIHICRWSNGIWSHGLMMHRQRIKAGSAAA